MLSLYLLLSGITLGLFGYVSWKETRTGIYLLLAFLPIYLLRFSFFSIPTTLLELLFLTLFFVWIIRSRGKELIASWNTLPNGWRISIGILLLAATINVVVSPTHASALGIWKAYFIEPILFFFLILSVLKTTKDREGALIALTSGGIFIAVFGIFQYLSGTGFPIPWDVERRVTSIFPYPNAVGLYLGPLIVIAAFMLFRRPPLRSATIFWMGSLILMVTAIFLSQTEAAWAAIPAAIFLITLFLPRARRFTIPLAAVGILLIFITPLHPIFLQKISLHDYSGEVRRKQWEETTNMLHDHVLFGAGLDGYTTALIPYHTHPEIEIFQYPHNIVLNIWSELGVLGLIGFILLSWQIVCIGRGIFSRSLTEDQWITITCLAALLQMTIHGLVDVPYFKNDLSMMTWALLAVVLASSQATKQSPKT